jgi:hypothetical protein
VTNRKTLKVDTPHKTDPGTATGAAAVAQTTYAVKNGVPITWGKNINQLVTGVPNDAEANVKVISTGQRHVMAITSANKLVQWCGGGIEAKLCQAGVVPDALKTAAVTDIAAGSFHSAARVASGVGSGIYCWGASKPEGGTD